MSDPIEFNAVEEFWKSLGEDKQKPHIYILDRITYEHLYNCMTDEQRKLFGLDEKDVNAK